jgi:hypothetical protein
MAGKTGLSLAGCSALRDFHAYGMNEDFSVANCNLGPDALNRIYGNLATVAKIITVTGNWGAAYDTPAIATGKGWFVTGT